MEKGADRPYRGPVGHRKELSVSSGGAGEPLAESYSGISQLNIIRITLDTALRTHSRSRKEGGDQLRDYFNNSGER